MDLGKHIYSSVKFLPELGAIFPRLGDLSVKPMSVDCLLGDLYDAVAMKETCKNA